MPLVCSPFDELTDFSSARRTYFPELEREKKG
jgi:hypothetical protein